METTPENCQFILSINDLSQRATDTNQELWNIPTKLRYEKTRHIEM